MNINSISISKLLLISFLTLLISTTSIIGFISFNRAKSSITKISFNNLISVRNIKKNQIEDYLKGIRNQITTFSEDQMIIDAMNGFKNAFHDIDKTIILTKEDYSEMTRSVKSYYETEYLPRLNPNLVKPKSITNFWPEDKVTNILQYHFISNNTFPVGEKDHKDTIPQVPGYSKLHEKFHPIIRNYLDTFGYYDIFLIDDKTGHIVYSVFKEVDYATSLITGPYKNTNFARAFQAAATASQKQFVKLVDFETYDPSYAAPASFIASPIFDSNNQRTGVLIFQMPIDKINEVMTGHQQWKTNGLGDSGETYLVADDNKMRSISRFLIEDPNGYFEALKKIDTAESTIARIKNLNTSILLQDVKTKAVEQAQSGKTGYEIINDYRNIPILSAYSPIEIPDVNWVILSEIDKSEAFHPVLTLMVQIAIAIVILLFFTIGTVFILVKSITNPIDILLKNINQMANGNLSVTIKQFKLTELNQLAQAIKYLADTVDTAIKRMNDLVKLALSFTADLSEGSKKMKDKRTKATEKFSDFSTSITEMSSSIENISESTGQSHTSSQEVLKLTEEGNKTTMEMNHTMNSIKNKFSISKEKLENLIHANKKVTNFVKIITEISEQSNLLALNATIEAARAGNEGKGFGVVANEIRKLAVNSQQSAEEVSQTIENATRHSSELLHAMEEGEAEVNLGSNLSSALENAFSNILTRINNVSEMIQDISSSMEEQNQVSDQISGTINILDEANNESNEISAEIEVKTEQIQQQIIEFQNNIKSFTDKFTAKG